MGKLADLSEALMGWFTDDDAVRAWWTWTGSPV